VPRFPGHSPRWSPGPRAEASPGPSSVRCRRLGARDSRGAWEPRSGRREERAARGDAGGAREIAASVRGAGTAGRCGLSPPPLPSLPVPPAPPLPSPLLPPLPAPPSRSLPAPSARPALERPRDRAAGPRRAPVALLRARGGVGGGSRSRVGGGRWDPSCPPLLANSSVRGEQVPKGCPQDGEDQDSPEDPRALSARTELGWKDLGFPLHPALEPSFQEVASCGARPNRTEPNERERGNWLNPVLPSPLVYPRDGRPR
jgi:hypothetical protein